ncbi:hypothetical protein KGP39_04205 [Weissella hellenica]|nr:hypothetical protein [Weissella hellenica]
MSKYKWIKLLVLPALMGIVGGILGIELLKNFKDFWEVILPTWLSAIGTVGAVVISVYLSYKSNIKKSKIVLEGLKIIFLPQSGEGGAFKIYFVIHNDGNKTFVWKDTSLYLPHYFLKLKPDNFKFEDGSSVMITPDMTKEFYSYIDIDKISNRDAWNYDTLLRYFNESKIKIKIFSPENNYVERTIVLADINGL